MTEINTSKVVQIADYREPPPRVELTAEVAKNATAIPGQKRVLRCITRPGFCLVISKGGARSWAVEVRIAGSGKQRLRVISRVEAMPIKIAIRNYEKLHSEARGSDATDISKAAQKARLHPGLTLQAAHDARQAAKRAGKNNKPLSQGSLNTYDTRVAVLIAVFGGGDMWAITRADCIRAHEKICDKYGPVSAYNALRYLQTLWRYSSRKFEEARTCPTVALDDDLAAPPPRDGTVLAALGEWWKTIAAIPLRYGFESTAPVWALYFRTMLLTGCRRNEWLALRWEWVDLKKRTIRLPKAVTKNGHDHEFPIGKKLAQMLAAHRATQEKGAEFVFTYPSDCPVRFAGLPLKYVCKITKRYRATFSLKWSPHALRRTYASIAPKVGTPFLMQKQLMNHIAKDVTGRYAQIPVEDLRPWQEAIEAEILRLVR